MKSASGEIDFDTIYFNKSLHDWVLETNKKLSKINNFKTIRIKEGKFGFDVLATMIHNVMTSLIEDPNDIMLYMRKELDVEQFHNILHGSWINCYLVWKNRKPWLTNGNYIESKKELITSFNDNFATTYFDQLTLDTQNMYLEIFHIILSNVSTIVLENGLKNLQM